MESLTKNRQSPEALEAMVDRAYGPGQWLGRAEELGHGWFNVAYRIPLRDGRHVVLKIAPPPHVEVMTYERDIMRTEVHALELIRKQTRVPVPEVHHYEPGDADHFFMEYVDADNLGIIMDGLPPETFAGYSQALGGLNRELNQIRGDHFGPLLGGDPAATWRQVFTGIVEDVLRDGERRTVDIGHDYDAVRAIMVRHADCLDEVTEPVFIEWDLWESNVMVRDGAIVSIIDHERAIYGDPLLEAGFVFTALDEPTGERAGDPTAFVRGYGWGPATAAERMRRRLYNLHLILIMVIETVYRGHTDPGQYVQARGRLDTIMTSFDR